MKTFDDKRKYISTSKVQAVKSHQTIRKKLVQKINFQILLEIEFGDSKSAKSAILTNLEALNFQLYEFFALFEG